MKHIDHYDLIPSYTMKCRLYPNKECAKKIDNAIYAVQLYHNCLLYDVFNNFFGTKEVEYKPKKNKKPEQKAGESETEYLARLYEYEQKSKYKAGDIIHFLNLSELFTAEYKKKMIEEHPIIGEAPQSAITTNVGLKADIGKSINVKLPIEFQKPTYYSKKKKRESYSYQESFRKISVKDNNNVLYIDLAKIGTCKIRGWNKNIRFDSAGTIDFVEYIKTNRKDKVTVTIKKDKCGDYWICFALSNVYKPTVEQVNNATGIDVGVSDIVILSDGTKYENKRFKAAEEEHLDFLMTKQSKQYGWKNQRFKDEHKKNPELKVSKGYIKTGVKIAKLNRKIARKRNNYNHNVTRDIINKYYFIGIESLDVKGLMESFNDDKTNSQNATTHRNLSDAAIGDILCMLKYKSEWHNRKIVAVNKYFASSKICNHCGYKMSEMPVSVREWTCPNCGLKHDRDVNASNNIKKQALIDTYGEKLGNEYYELGFVYNVA